VPHGRAIDAEINTRNGIRSTSIEIEKNGVRTVGVDLETGNVLRVREADADDAGGADETLTRKTVTRTPMSRF
jgi:hypothetical protein